MRLGSRGHASNSVDLSRVINVSVDLESLDVSSIDGVQVVVGGKDVSSDGSSGNSDGSSRSQDVEEDDLSSDGLGDVVSTEQDVSGSGNVDDQLNFSVALGSEDVVSNSVEVGRVDGERIRRSTGRSADDVEVSIRNNGEIDVVGNGSEGALQVSVVDSSSSKVRSDRRSETGILLGRRSEIIGGSDGSSNVHILSERSELIVR
jgi:hypothetical protein